MPPYLWFKKSIYRNLKSENSHRLCQETSALLYVHEFGFFINVLTISWKAQGVVGHLRCLASLSGSRESKRYRGYVGLEKFFIWLASSVYHCYHCSMVGEKNVQRISPLHNYLHIIICRIDLSHYYMHIGGYRYCVK
jgi:hypothetical protein